MDRQEHQVASLDVQLEEACRYLAARGWTLHRRRHLAGRVQETSRFPGSTERRRGPFVVTRDETRLGGDTYRTGIVIQHLLDHGARGIASPRPRTAKSGAGAWCSGSIKPMLHRKRYRGVIVWGTKEKAYRKGTKVRLDLPECEWIRVNVPDLRIGDGGCQRDGQRRSEAQATPALEGAEEMPHASSDARCRGSGGDLEQLRNLGDGTPVQVAQRQRNAHVQRHYGQGA